MITVQLSGGLGNQMFQYAAGRYLSLKHKTDLVLDLSFLLDRTPRKGFVFRDYDLDIFAINPRIASKDEELNHGFRARRIQRVLYSIKQKINTRLPVYVHESPRGFDPDYYSIPSHAYLEGYWQSEDYFKEIESTIRQDFVFKGRLDEYGTAMAEIINSVNSVCLFVRRGDYVTDKNTSQYHGVCDMEYYDRSFRLISEKTKNPVLFIFSDDLDWCRTYLKFNVSTYYVDNLYSGHKYGQHLHLMTSCRHFIISNSTFGWWGAWRNPDSHKIVIAPKQWHKNPSMDTSHLFPKNWITI